MAKMTPELARKILAARNAADPLKHYRPTVTQDLFHKSLATHRMLSSVTRGGKSAAGCADLAMFARGIHPARKWYGPVRILQFVISRFQAAEVIGKKLFKGSELQIPGMESLREKPMIPEYEIADPGYMTIAGQKIPYNTVLKNGTQIMFRWSGVADVWKTIQGAAPDAIYVDEDVGTEELWDEIYFRLLDAQSDKSRPNGGFSVWTATNTEFNPSFSAYKERGLAGEHGHAYFQIGHNENVAIDSEKREKLGALMSSEDAAAIRVYGSKDSGDTNRIFPQFDHRRHITADYEPTENDNIWLGWDPGIKDEYGLMFCCTCPESPMTVRVLDFLHERGTTIDHQTQQVARWLEGRTLEGVITDPSANKHEYSRGKAIIELFKESLFGQLKVQTHRGVLIGRNRLEDTVPVVRRYLDPDPDNKEVRPMLLFNESAKYAADMIAKARLKNGATRVAFNTIAGKNLEAFDLIRYILSRTPHWIQRPPNTRAFSNIKASAIPIAKPPSLDPFVITPDMPDDVKLHRMRMRESTRMMESFGATGKGGRQIATRYMDW